MCDKKKTYGSAAEFVNDLGNNTSFNLAYSLWCDELAAQGKSEFPTKREFLDEIKRTPRRVFGTTRVQAVEDRDIEIGGAEALSRDDYQEYLKVVATETGIPHPIKDVRAYIQDFPVDFLRQLIMFRRQGNFKLLADMFKVTVQQMGMIIKDVYGYTVKELETFAHFSATTRQPICGEWEVVCMHGWVYDELAKLNLPVSRASAVFGIKDSTYLHLIDLSDTTPVGYAIKLSSINWANEIRMASQVVPEPLVFSALGVVETYTTRA